MAPATAEATEGLLDCAHREAGLSGKLGRRPAPLARRSSCLRGICLNGVGVPLRDPVRFRHPHESGMMQGGSSPRSAIVCLLIRSAAMEAPSGRLTLISGPLSPSNSRITTAITSSGDDRSPPSFLDFRQPQRWWQYLQDGQGQEIGEDPHDLPVSRPRSRSVLVHVRLKGHLGSDRDSWFDGMNPSIDSDGTTVLEGSVVDQSALHGLLTKLRNTGLPLLSVTPNHPHRPHQPRQKKENDMTATPARTTTGRLAPADCTRTCSNRLQARIAK